MCYFLRRSTPSPSDLDYALERTYMDVTVYAVVMLGIL